MKSSRVELLKVLAELSERFPDWRFGQLVANVATGARGPSVEAVWDCEDEELIAAARSLLVRTVVTVDLNSIPTPNVTT